VTNIFSGKKTKGKHEIQFDTQIFQSGMYFYILESAGMKQIKNMIIEK
jgi:hypothetical protein